MGIRTGRRDGDTDSAVLGFGNRSAALRLLAVAGAAAVFSLPSLCAQTARAAGISVTEAADELSFDGDCALREAIQAANTDAAVDACAAGDGADTIFLPIATYTLTVAGAGEDANAAGDLDVSSDLTIDGADPLGTIIDGADLDRVLDVDPAGAGVSVTVTDLTIRNGTTGIVNRGELALDRTTVSDNTDSGIRNEGSASLTETVVSGNTAPTQGGGIDNRGALTLYDVAVFNNTSGGSAGGIRSTGPLTLDYSTVSGNSAALHAGGIDSDSDLTLTNSTVTGNVARELGGGGIFYAADDSHIATLNDSAVAGNGAAGASGGGIRVQSGATLEATGTTVSNNFANAAGGGVWSAGTVNLDSSTVSTNSGASGGGLNNYGGSLTLANATVSGNSAGEGGGIVNAEADGSVGQVELSDTIVANDQDGAGPSDCEGPIDSAGHNLIESTGGCTISGETTTNVVGLDPRLSPLQNNGGPTQTHALLTGSPAIDAGGASCPAQDQRGIARPQGTSCDIGAVEARGDSDLDGCTDDQEVGPSVALGGHRDPSNPWDFIDVPTGSEFARDRSVSGADIAAVVMRFGSNDATPGLFNQQSDLLSTPNPAVAPPGARANYHPAFDRGGTVPGGDPWDLLPADGSISGGDIAAAVIQFGHRCV